MLLITIGHALLRAFLMIQNNEVFYRDRVEDESSEFKPALLRVHKPEFQKCPEPDAILKGWLYPSWGSFHNEVRTRERIS